MKNPHKLCPVCKTGIVASAKKHIYCSMKCAWVIRKPKKNLENADSWFWLKCERKSENECWEWTGHINDNGYGRISNYNGKRREYAHRVAFHLTHSRYPNGVTRHKCDNKKCINPLHLTEGSIGDNSEDAVLRHNVCFGEKSPNAKLNNAAITFILLHSEIPSADLARKYGVHNSQICRVRKGKTWKRAQSSLPLVP